MANLDNSTMIRLFFGSYGSTEDMVESLEYDEKKSANIKDKFRVWPCNSTNNIALREGSYKLLKEDKPQKGDMVRIPSYIAALGRYNLFDIRYRISKL